MISDLAKKVIRKSWQPRKKIRSNTYATSLSKICVNNCKIVLTLSSRIVEFDILLEKYFLLFCIDIDSGLINFQMKKEEKSK